LRLNPKKLLIATVILFVVFLLACGVGAFNAYTYGASSSSEAVFAVSAPFFGGFVLIGFFGLMQVYKNRASAQCLYGFLIVGFCYGGIEILFQACGGV
jgi:hypothetical protein